MTDLSNSIGAACAIKLAQSGVNLALTYSTSLDAVSALENRLVATYPTIHLSLHKVDVSSSDDLARLFTEVHEKHSGKTIDILVSNAGYGKRIVDIWDCSLEEFEKTINVNLRAGFILVKGVVEGMKAQKWGRIIFIGSIAGHGGGINGCHYAASKGGLMGMSKNLSNHLAKYNISVNDVAPAMIGNTGMIPSPEKLPGVVETIPLGRFGETEEVANIVDMFAKTGYCTGQSLVLGGGLK